MKVFSYKETMIDHKQQDGSRFLPRGFYQYLIHPTHLKRFLFFLIFDSAIIVFSLYASFSMRFEFVIPFKYKVLLLEVLPAFLLIKLIAFLCFKIYKITWRYVGINDLVNIAIAQTGSISALAMLILIPPPPWLPHGIPGLFSFNMNINGFPRSVFLIDGMVSFVLFCGLRFSKRLFLEIIHKGVITHTGKKTLIIGAGNTGDMIVRDMKRQGYREYCPIGMLDDNINTVGTRIQGVKVLGTTDKLRDIVSQYEVEAIIIAIPSLNYKTLRKIYELAKQLRVNTVKIVPRIYDLHKPDIDTQNLEDICIEDLLGRQKVTIDYQGIEEFLKDKVIFITGAGGSIGSELVMQACQFHPKQIVLFDIDETELHKVKLRLERLFPNYFHGQPAHARAQGNVVFITGDIRDEYVVNETFRKFKPQVVFHAAANKHVPMMEMNAREAVQVNMFGTYQVAKAASDHQAEKFILISTDKAVCPTSIMGATKRMAEYICTALNGCTNTAFVSVRFGNVLGSRGSVLPIFLDQLKQGGPLTVTHKDVERFFMTIPEAVSLVLQSSTIGNGGDVLVLDMGEPIRIVTLAEELIRIHGLKPHKEIDIAFTGLRPGEKLFEEILTAEEGTTASKHEKIFIAKNSERYSKEEIEKILRGFEKLLKVLPITEDYEIIRDALKNYVKSFERRRQKRPPGGSEGIANTVLSQTDETNMQYYKMQFDELLKVLPILENHEKIIRDTLKNYGNSLERRRQKINFSTPPGTIPQPEQGQSAPENLIN
ncbi:UDP-N-acetyl-alpha-D-glucosamine C6 dehydratase [Candidatus Brocadiaceae bacterium B188]|nr:UDP-N-acetyl-alpha-D-glucosamine C6 dehydratase [Candidatus Brocadiaceae bacterium B188]